MFLDRWGQRGPRPRRAVVVVFSDGWERGDADLLGEQMRRLHGLAHRVVWVNPHVGKDGYQPVQQGIVAALPHVDDFLAGHSLADVRGARGGGARMREVLRELMRWWRAGETVGIGTVVATFRSAPRPPGASMLVGPDGAAVGSVSRRLRRGRGLRARRRRWSPRHAGAASGTASATTTPSRSA